MVEKTVKKYVGKHSTKERGYPPFYEAVLNWLHDHMETIERLDAALTGSEIIDRSGIVAHAHKRLTNQMGELAQLLQWGIETWDKQPGTIRFAMELCCATCRAFLEQQIKEFPNREQLMAVANKATEVTQELVATTQEFPAFSEKKAKEYLKKYPNEVNH